MNAIERVEPQDVSVQWRNSTDVAGLVREFAIARTLNIQGKRYPPVVVWQAIANAFGCVASARDVKAIDGGVSAIGEVKRMSDGMVISEGEGFVGDDEKTWSSRPLFARRAMAQTRAIGRACRAAFAFVIPMIDSNMQTTPAEEMEAMADSSPVARPTHSAINKTTANILKEQIAARMAKSLPLESVEVVPAPEADLDPDGYIPFGKHKDSHVSNPDVSLADLKWLDGAVAESVEDPAKSRFQSKNQALLDAIRAEIERR
mgnify:CR=1 FL=1